MPLIAPHLIYCWLVFQSTHVKSLRRRLHALSALPRRDGGSRAGTPFAPEAAADGSVLHVEQLQGLLDDASAQADPARAAHDTGSGLVGESWLSQVPTTALPRSAGEAKVPSSTAAGAKSKPRLQRCGTCKHCLNPTAKKGCLRNKEEQEAAATSDASLPAALPAPDVLAAAEQLGEFVYMYFHEHTISAGTMRSSGLLSVRHGPNSVPLASQTSENSSAEAVSTHVGPPP